MTFLLENPKGDAAFAKLRYTVTIVAKRLTDGSRVFAVHMRELDVEAPVVFDCVSEADARILANTLHGYGPISRRSPLAPMASGAMGGRLPALPGEVSIMNGGKIKGFEYHIGRTMRGELRALTVVDLGFDRRALRVDTDKAARGGVSTTATVVQLAEDGRGYSHMLFVDYSKTIAQAPGRATETLIRTVHERALLELETTIGEARARYAPPVATAQADAEAAAAIAKARAAGVQS